MVGDGDDDDDEENGGGGGTAPDPFRATRVQRFQRVQRRLRTPPYTSGEPRFTVFSFPPCISRRCNVNAEQRILTFFARRNVGTRRCPRSRLSARMREESPSLSLSFSLFYRFLSPFSFPLASRTFAFPFDLALAIDDDDGEDDTTNCPLL